MEGDGKRARQFDELSGALHIHVARRIENAENHTVGACILGDLDIAAKDIEFFFRVAEVTGARTNDRMNSDRQPGADSLQQSNAGSNAAFEQVAAQLDTLCAAALRGHRRGNRVDADFDEHLFCHDLLVTKPARAVH